MATHDEEDPIRISRIARASAGDAPGAAEGAGALESAEQAESAGATRAVDGAGQVAATGGADGVGATQSLGAVADALAQGTMSISEAQSQLIERALAAQLPAGTDPAVLAELRAEVEALLAGDPTLAQLLRP